MNSNDILAGFDSYATPEEIADTNAADAPATTVPCSALASYTTAQLSC
ncbi:MAG: LxmA leader domain family RiPP [Rhodococcus sp. (in: high G+C Gram-positive bacteria)]